MYITNELSKDIRFEFLDNQSLMMLAGALVLQTRMKTAISSKAL